MLQVLTLLKADYSVQPSEQSQEGGGAAITSIFQVMKMEVEWKDCLNWKGRDSD